MPKYIEGLNEEEIRQVRIQRKRYQACIRLGFPDDIAVSFAVAKNGDYFLDLRGLISKYKSAIKRGFSEIDAGRLAVLPIRGRPLRTDLEVIAEREVPIEALSL